MSCVAVDVGVIFLHDQQNLLCYQVHTGKLYSCWYEVCEILAFNQNMPCYQVHTNELCYCWYLYELCLCVHDILASCFVAG